jgi:hypothetical protein
MLFPPLIVFFCQVWAGSDKESVEKVMTFCFGYES